jgi:multiple sugar transport system ATP-binding protein
MAAITIDRVTKIYPNGFEALDELDLDVADGELLVLVGPSRCGKTTALRMVAGLEDASIGTLSIGGRIANDVSPKDRDIAMVFQNCALCSHMTVAKNIGFALKLRRLPKSEINRKVAEAAELLGLTEWLDRKPAQLSGGWRQRVAMGCAIVREPSVFLMDEPLSNLDAKLRVRMRAEAARTQRRLGVTTLYVIHDQVEAMTMGDRVAVLRAGFFSNATAPRCSTTARARLRGRVHGFARYEPIWGETPDGAVSAVVGTQRLALPESLLASGPGLGTYASSVRMRWSPAPKTSRARSRVPARASPESSFVPSSPPARGCASTSTRPRSASSTRRAANATGDGPTDAGAAGTVSAVVACGTLDIIMSTSSAWLQESGEQEEGD